MIRIVKKIHLESRLALFKRPCKKKKPCPPAGVWRESSRDSRTPRCMEAANDYITQSVGVLMVGGAGVSLVKQ